MGVEQGFMKILGEFQTLSPEEFSPSKTKAKRVVKNLPKLKKKLNKRRSHQTETRRLLKISASKNTNFLETLKKRIQEESKERMKNYQNKIQNFGNPTMNKFYQTAMKDGKSKNLQNLKILGRLTAKTGMSKISALSSTQTLQPEILNIRKHKSNNNWCKFRSIQQCTSHKIRQEPKKTTQSEVLRSY